MTHTPGPWMATTQGSNTIYIHDEVRNGKSFGTIAEIGSDSAYPDIHKQDKANAHLIAAAPEMLEMLRDILTAMRTDFDMQGLRYGYERELEAAIAKAEGRA